MNDEVLCRHVLPLTSCSFLQDDGPWQATLRAICVLEAIIQMGATEVCGKVAVAFQVSGLCTTCTKHLVS